MDHNRAISRRYSRNIALLEIGQDGQDALLDSSVLVVGAGGLGSPLMLYLAAAGVGTIGIVDSDRIEISNLQRQILYGNHSIGKAKVDEAAEAIFRLNPDVRIIKHKVRFGDGSPARSVTLNNGNEGYFNNFESKPELENAASNIDSTASPLHNAICTEEELVRNYDIIADCSDNFATRFIINEACFASKKTLIMGAVTGFNGQISTFKAYLGAGHPCYRCFCPNMPPENLLPNCASGGVLGSVAGVVGAMQATEIIKEILGVGTSLSGAMIIYDGLHAKIRKINLKKNKYCNMCNIS